MGGGLKMGTVSKVRIGMVGDGRSLPLMARYLVSERLDVPCQEEMRSSYTKYNI